MTVCLDAYAIMAWLRDEAGAAAVDGFLQRAARESEFRCLVSAINLGEVYYRLWRTSGADQANAFWDDAWRSQLPLSIVEPSRKRIMLAAGLKGRHPIALGDAFAVQVAQEMQAPLVTGDPEIQDIAEAEHLTLLWIGPHR